MGTQNQPNVKVIERGTQGTKAIIEDPNVWRPGGLVQPIYWLQTGHRHPKLKAQKDKNLDL